jgi:hypothetical protein
VGSGTAAYRDAWQETHDYHQLVGIVISAAGRHHDSCTQLADTAIPILSWQASQCPRLPVSLGTTARCGT